MNRHLLAVSLGLLVAGLTGSRLLAEEFTSRVQFDAIAYDDGEGTPLNNCASVSCDPQAREVLVADPGNNRIVIFDEDLIPKFSFPHFVTSRDKSQLIAGEPRSVIANSRGEFIVVDNQASYIDLLDFRGTPMEQFSLGKIFGDTTLNLRPEALARDENDNLYVVAGGDLQTVFVLDPEFKLKRTIGKKGGEPQDFNTPVAVAVFDNLVVVTDLYAKPAVKIFDTAGNYVRGFGGHEVERGDLSLGSGIAIVRDSTGSIFIWVSDALRQTIKVYTEEGSFVSTVAGYGHGFGDISYPAGIATDGRGKFFVVERVGRRIQRFRFQ